MRSIGKSDEVDRTSGSLADRMLTEWSRVRLVPPTLADATAADAIDDSSYRVPPKNVDGGDGGDGGEEGGGVDAEGVAKRIGEAVREAMTRAAIDVGGAGAESADGSADGSKSGGTVEPPSPVTVGTVLRAGSPADRFLLSEQFLHKALMLVVHELPGGASVACVLNRPTANLVQFHSDNNPRRCISFGGDGRLRGEGLGIDANGLMWLGQTDLLSDKLIEAGDVMGDSGLCRVPALETAETIKNGESKLEDFLLVSGERTSHQQADCGRRARSLAPSRARPPPPTIAARHPAIAPSIAHARHARTHAHAPHHTRTHHC